MPRLAVAGEVVGVAQVDDDLRAEWLSGAGAVAGLVEQLGRVGVRVIVEELVEQRERVSVGLAGLEALRRSRDREPDGLPAAETDVQVDLVGLVERDVFDQEPGDPFAFALRRCGV